MKIYLKRGDPLRDLRSLEMVTELLKEEDEVGTLS